MTREEFLDDLGKNYKKSLDIVKKKNKDYSADSDPFQNLKSCEAVLGISLEKGILVRVLDKINRINQLTEKEAEVKDESIEDTLIDLITYANILLVYLQNKK